MGLSILDLWLGKVSKLLSERKLFQALTEARQRPDISMAKEREVRFTSVRFDSGSRHEGECRVSLSESETHSLNLNYSHDR